MPRAISHEKGGCCPNITFLYECRGPQNVITWAANGPQAAPLRLMRERWQGATMFWGSLSVEPGHAKQFKKCTHDDEWASKGGVVRRGTLMMTFLEGHCVNTHILPCLEGKKCLPVFKVIKLETKIHPFDLFLCKYYYNVETCSS